MKPALALTILGLAITAGLFAVLAWSAQAADCALAHLEVSA